MTKRRLWVEQNEIEMLVIRILKVGVMVGDIAQWRCSACSPNMGSWVRQYC